MGYCKKLTIPKSELTRIHCRMTEKRLALEQAKRENVNVWQVVQWWRVAYEKEKKT